MNAERVQQPGGFTLRPGDGWIFNQTSAQGVHTFQGHIKLSESETYQVQGKLVEDEHKYKLDVRKFGGDWPTIASFELPQLGDKPFVEGEVDIPYDEPVEWQGMKVTSRKLKVRAFRFVTSKGEAVLRLRFPQIQRTVDAPNKVIP